MATEPPLQGFRVNPAHHSESEPGAKMAAADGDESLYPIAVLHHELRNEYVQVQAVTAGALLF